MNNRKVMLYIAMSVDGYIAAPNDDLSFLSVVEQQGEDYGYTEFTSSIDTYIVGRKTYEVVKGMIGAFPQAHQYDCYVLTRQQRENEDGVTFYSGDIRNLIQELQSKPGKHIYCDGGGEIVHLLMQHNLIDEYIISIIPTIVGDGRRLFIGGTPPLGLQALPPTYYPSTGLVQVRYIKATV